MAAKFRYFEKKRGHRRTGSSTLGNAGETLFYAVFFLVGCAGLTVLFALLVVPQWRANHEFVATTCKVAEASAKQKDTSDGKSYRPEIKIEYEVDGTTHHVWTYDVATVRDRQDWHSIGDAKVEREVSGRFREVFDRFSPGTEHPCWYDPASPEVVVLVRGYSWWLWLVFIIPLSFIVIGGVGLIYRLFSWGKSTERKAAMSQRVRESDLFGNNGRPQREYPCIPNGLNVTNSPGTTLRFRLPISTSPGWALFGTLVACLFWNGIVSVFVVAAVKEHLGGDPDWVLTLFMVPFVLIGIALIVFFIRQLLVTTGIGPTLVEISDHPLHPGQESRLFVSQSGRLRMNSLKVLLVCEEKATYRQGTDTRTETSEVLRQEILSHEGFEVHRGLPFETECELAVPAAAMHSFKADHNEIDWKLLVEGDVAGWPDYKRAFQVIIRPSNGSNGA